MSGWSAGVVILKMAFSDGTTEIGSFGVIMDRIGSSDAVMQHLVSRLSIMEAASGVSLMANKRRREGDEAFAMQKNSCSTPKNVDN